MEARKVTETITHLLLDEDETRILRDYCQNFMGNVNQESTECNKFRRELFTALSLPNPDAKSEVEEDDIPF